MCLKPTWPRKKGCRLVYEEVAKRNIHISFLINNAGFGSLTEFAEAKICRELNMLSLNCGAPLALISSFLPKMLEQGEGTIVNVCSTCSFQPMPYMATYGATKAFLYSLSTALNQELKNSGIRVVAHCPGPTHSEFHLAAGLPEKMSELPAMNAKEVVLDCLNRIDRGKNVIINGRLNRFLAFLSGILPVSLSTRLVSRSLVKHLPKVVFLTNICYRP